MKTPSALFAVSAALAFKSACAVGGTVHEEVPAGDEAADQTRTATEPVVEIAATESPPSIEALMPYIADGALPKIQHVEQTKGGSVLVQTAIYEAKEEACSLLSSAKVETNRSTTGPRQWINFRPESEDFQGTQSK
jgi:hypothetical protein